MLVRPAVRRCALGALALISLGFVLHPAWAQSAGVDVWNLPGLQRQLREADDEDRRLSADNAELMRCLRAKEATVADLLAGRVTLAEAADRFSLLNASRPQCAARVRECYAGSTDREKYAQNVIDFALHRVPSHEQPDVAARLEVEFRHVLAASARP
jgi:hypothetical protein